MLGSLFAGHAYADIAQTNGDVQGPSLTLPMSGATAGMTPSRKHPAAGGSGRVSKEACREGNGDKKRLLRS